MARASRGSQWWAESNNEQFLSLGYTMPHCMCLSRLLKGEGGERNDVWAEFSLTHSVKREAGSAVRPSARSWTGLRKSWRHWGVGFSF